MTDLQNRGVEKGKLFRQLLIFVVNTLKSVL